MATVRRRRRVSKPKSAAQIAAAKKNLEKARAARSAASKGKASVGKPDPGFGRKYISAGGKPVILSNSHDLKKTTESKLVKHMKSLETQGKSIKNVLRVLTSGKEPSQSTLAGLGIKTTRRRRRTTSK